MSYTLDKDIEISTSIKSDKRCYGCNVSIYSSYFAPKKSETLSGRPARDQITGKVKPLDPSIKEYHTCKPEDMETFKATNEYKQKLYEWKVNQQPRNQYQNCNNSSRTKYIDATQN